MNAYGYYTNHGKNDDDDDDDELNRLIEKQI